MAAQSPDTVQATADPLVATTGGHPTIAGYDVQELVGRGGMGKVYRARHLQLGRTVAIKVMTQEQDERLTARFRDEARAVAKLQHPNIAQLFDTGTADGRPYYSLEFADGGTLAGLWDGTPQDPTAAAATMECVARAIQYSHEHGILHRDLKPGNVLLAGDGTPKVADFGLAKEIASAAPGASTMPGLEAHTRTGEIVGTPAYMPPEQASGVSSTLTAAADVYALGAMLYEALTGRPPFQAPDALQTLFLVLSAEPVPPKVLQPKLPADLNTICMKCLEKQPKKRYVSAGDLADDLRRWQRGEPIVARPVGRVERAVKWAKRNKAGAALVGVSAVLLLAVIGFGVWEAINAVRLREANDQLAAKNGELEEANRKLTEAKAEADQSYTLATAALDDVARDVGIRLHRLPQGEELMLDVVAKTSDLYRRLAELRASDREVADRYARSLIFRSTIETGYGKMDSAARSRAALSAFLAKELQVRPDDAELWGLRVSVAFDAVTTAQSESPPARAPAARAAYYELADKYAARFPDRVDALKRQVQAHWFRRFDASARKDPAGEIAAMSDAVAAARRLPDGTPPDAQTRFDLLSASLSMLGMVYQRNDRFDEAEKVFVEEQAVYAAGQAHPDREVSCRAGMATAAVRRADIAWALRRPQDAAKLYAEAEPVLRQLVKDFPLTANHRLQLAECLYAQGVLKASTDPAACKALANEAVEVLEQLVKNDPGNAAYKVRRDEYAGMRADLLKRLEKK